MKNTDFLEMGMASKALGVSIDTLRKWADAGKIEVYRDNNNRRIFKKADVEAMLVTLNTVTRELTQFETM